MTRLFGTNGIRGVVNEDMNCLLAVEIGQAWGTYLKRTNARPKVAIGTDARLSNDMIKNAITSGFLSTGCDVVDLGLIPTPAVQYSVKKKDFNSGVVITASHNPPEFNGIKGIDSDGTEFSKEVEEEIEAIYFEKSFDFALWNKVGKNCIWDGSIDLYINGILETVDVEAIKKKRFHVVLDCGNGVGSLVTPFLLEKLGCNITKLYCEPDGTFPGHNSEPLPENLSELILKVPEVGADFGVAQDGDADRAIFVDEKGNYLWGDKSLALVAKYKTKQNNGGVLVTPVTTSSCFDDVVKMHNGTIIHTMVGSPVVARVMMENDAIFGGEENGGLIFPEMQHCRDSAMSIAKILEILTYENNKMSDLIDEIPNYETYKIKIKCPNEKKNELIEIVSKKISDESDIISIDKTDGLKLYVSDGWVIMRPSGTEPIFRIYSESKEKERSKELAQYYQNMAQKIIDSFN